MKVTVYVPDYLWNVAVDLFPSDHPSALARRAVKALLRENDGPDLAAIVEDMADERAREYVNAVLDEVAS